ncbi:hypothetical protein ACFO26_01610 [Lactococcus nasutitermitis]|uniref:Uncharacterized protein n=1 Tax=Lactococcus nasutitermitis TaxID=1652957 RepID=A0ABV9JB30_9LACT|nr:hypothetical protein [Lactococcus nasutitermitis]
MKFSSDRYENILGGLSFGYFFVMLLFIILFFPQQSNSTTLNHTSFLFGVISTVVVYLWIGGVIVFGIMIVWQGNKIIKNKKKLRQSEEKIRKSQHSVNNKISHSIINYDKIHEEALKDYQKEQRKYKESEKNE